MIPDVRTSWGGSRSAEDQLGWQNDLPWQAGFEQDAGRDPSLLSCRLSYGRERRICENRVLSVVKTDD
jgi:hypothetical protein